MSARAACQHAYVREASVHMLSMSSPLVFRTESSDRGPSRRDMLCNSCKYLPYTRAKAHRHTVLFQTSSIGTQCLSISDTFKRGSRETKHNETNYQEGGENSNSSNKQSYTNLLRLHARGRESRGYLHAHSITPTHNSDF